MRTADGKLWSIAKNKQSAKFLSEKNIGKTIQIRGRNNKDTGLIEVKSFKIVQVKQSNFPAKETAIYTCPMHPEVKSDKPVDCPKCGMKLVKKS